MYRPFIVFARIVTILLLLAAVILMGRKKERQECGVKEQIIMELREKIELLEK